MMRFTITSREGLPIVGDLDVPARPRALALIVHGFKGFKDWGFFPWLAETLCEEQRIAVCRFNMSRSGIGENPETFERLDLFGDDTYSAQIDDLHSVAAHVQRQLSLPTFLVGHSRGGGVALLGARGIERLSGVVTWSAIATTDRWDETTREVWRRQGFMDVVNARTQQVMRMSTRILDDVESNRERLDIGAAAERLEVPLLVVHGGHDESVPVEESFAITRRARDVSHLVIDRATHTYNAIHPLVHVPRELRYAAAVTAHFITAYA